MEKVARAGFLIVLVVILLIVFYIFFSPKGKNGSQSFLTKKLPFESILEGGRIRGLDRDNLPWSLTAKKILIKKDFTEIFFVSPDLTKKLADNSSIHLYAEKGFYDRDKKIVRLDKNVVGIYKDIKVKGHRMIFNLETENIEFLDGVHIINRKLDIMGDEAIISSKMQLIKIIKNVKVVVL